MNYLRIILIAGFSIILQWCSAQLSIIYPSAFNKYETNQIITLSATNPMSSVSYNKFYWDFGDGKAIESTTSFASHIFLKKGIFKVTLVGERSDGQYDRITANLNLYDQVAINFNTIPNSSSPCGQDIKFLDESFDAVSWWWDLDDDGVTDSNLKNPIHTYPSHGMYSVKLEIETSTGLIVSKTFINTILFNCPGSYIRLASKPTVSQCTNAPYISAIDHIIGGSPSAGQPMPQGTPNPGKLFTYQKYQWSAKDANGLDLDLFNQEFEAESFLNLTDPRIQNAFNTTGEFTAYIQLKASDYSPSSPNSHMIVKFPITLFKRMVTRTSDVDYCPGTSDQLVGNWPMHNSQGGHSLFTSYKLLDSNGAALVGYSGLGTNPIVTLPPNNNETYTLEVTIQDNAGCTTIRTTDVNSKAIAVDLGDDFKVCLNESNRKMNPEINGGTGVYESYSWTPSLWLDDNTKKDPTILAITNNVANTYSLKVTDSNGCTGTDQITVTSNKTFPSITLPDAQEFCMLEFDDGGPDSWNVSSTNLLYFYDPPSFEDMPLIEPQSVSGSGEKEITWSQNNALLQRGDQFSLQSNLKYKNKYFFRTSQTFTARVTEVESGCFAEDEMDIIAKQDALFGFKNIVGTDNFCQEIYLCTSGINNPTWSPPYDLIQPYTFGSGFNYSPYNIASRQWVEQIKDNDDDPNSIKIVPEILNAYQTIPTVKLERSLTINQHITLASGCSNLAFNALQIIISKDFPEPDFTIDPCIKNLNEVNIINNTDFKTATSFTNCNPVSTLSDFKIEWDFGNTGIPNTKSEKLIIPGSDKNPGTANPFDMPKTDVIGFTSQGSKKITLDATNTCGTVSLSKTFNIAPNAMAGSSLIEICDPNFHDPNEQAAFVIRLAHNCISAEIQGNDKGHFVARNVITMQEGFVANSGSDFRARIDECMIEIQSLQEIEVIEDEQLNALSGSTENNTNPELVDKKDITSIESNKILIYPNPSNGFISIEVLGEIDVNGSITITTTQGTKLLKTALLAKNELDLSKIAKGIYLVVLQNGSSYDVERIVIN